MNSPVLWRSIDCCFAALSSVYKTGQQSQYLTSGGKEALTLSFLTICSIVTGVSQKFKCLCWPITLALLPETLGGPEPMRETPFIEPWLPARPLICAMLWLNGGFMRLPPDPGSISPKFKSIVPDPLP